MKYLLNSPILTSYGDYQYLPCTLDQARSLLDQGFVSAVGHVATAVYLTELLGIEVPVNRIKVAMVPGDDALVFALKSRLEEGSVLNEVTLRKIDFELGIIRRLA